MGIVGINFGSYLHSEYMVKQMPPWPEAIQNDVQSLCLTPRLTTVKRTRDGGVSVRNAVVLWRVDGDRRGRVFFVSGSLPPPGFGGSGVAYACVTVSRDVYSPVPNGQPELAYVTGEQGSDGPRVRVSSSFENSYFFPIAMLGASGEFRVLDFGPFVVYEGLAVGSTICCRENDFYKEVESNDAVICAGGQGGFVDGFDFSEAVEKYTDYFEQVDPGSEGEKVYVHLKSNSFDFRTILISAATKT